MILSTSFGAVPVPGSVTAKRTVRSEVEPDAARCVHGRRPTVAERSRVLEHLAERGRAVLERVTSAGSVVDMCALGASGIASVAILSGSDPTRRMVRIE